LFIKIFEKTGQDLSPNGDLSQTDVIFQFVFDETPDEADAETDSDFCDCIEVVIVQLDL
jgi:hypothetical protein